MLLSTPCLNGYLGEITFIISLGQKHNFVVYSKGNRWIKYCKGCARVDFYDEVSAEDQGIMSAGVH